MQSFVLLITCLLTVWCAEVKASVFHLNQTVDQTVTQAVKEKNWKLKVDMAFRFVFYDGEWGRCYPLFAVCGERTE